MQSKRHKTSGFTLLETLLAAAALALIAIPTMSAFSRAAEQDGPRVARFEAHEFAVSLMEERGATRDFSPQSGSYENRYKFEVRAEPHPALQPTRYDDLIVFTMLTVSVGFANEDIKPVEISQIFARAVQK